MIPENEDEIDEITEDTWYMIIPDNAPERLCGEKLYSKLVDKGSEKSELRFWIDADFELNGQEIGYLKYIVGETIDSMKESNVFENIEIGDARFETKKLN